MKIAVFGAGYVGLSTAILFAQKFATIVVDVVEEKIDALNSGICPFDDPDFTRHLQKTNNNLSATLDAQSACENADLIIVATPTNYCEKLCRFDTSDIESLVQNISLWNKRATIVIRSTVPIGFCGQLDEIVENEIVFCPEFLREGQAIRDGFDPTRIVVGGAPKRAQEFADILLSCAQTPQVPVVITGITEAEAIKMFANEYLAMRVAYFNELDSFALENDFDAASIVKGVSLDPRIGMFYNNPSFGYGGYCLPKDSQCLANQMPEKHNEVASAIPRSNASRKRLIAETILSSGYKTIGIYRLCMKSESDNFREAAIIDIISMLIEGGCEVVIYEPLSSTREFMQVPVISDFDEFSRKADVIVANRVDQKLEPVLGKVFTRDIFGRD